MINHRFKRGFTLVELLVVIAIIGMLSAISITTVRASIQSAKETQTRTTIAKIDNVLTACYEKYQYRRVDLTGKLPSPVDNRYANSPEIRARYRLQIIRDLLRCDFPCTPVELDTKSQYNGDSSSDFTPLQKALVAAAGGSLSSYDFEDENYPEDFGTATNHGGYPHVANAELLYLVVMNADPEARAAFSDREIGDVDRNGAVNMKDVLLLRRVVSGDADLDEKEAASADVNGDGAINMKDVLMLRRILAGDE